MVDFLQTKTVPVTIILTSIVVIKSIYKWVILIESAHFTRLEYFVI